MSRPALEIPVEGLADDTVRLRLPAEADAPAIAAICQDPEIPRWTRVPAPYDEMTAGAWIGQTDADRDAGQSLGLLIASLDGAAILGSIGIVELDWEDARCQVGYFLAREARGQGLVTRAIGLLSAWVFKALPIDRIGILAEPANMASRAAAERAGFSFEAVLRSYLVNKGTRRDAASYSLLRGELR